MTYYETFAAHYGRTIPPEQPDPYVGLNWVPVHRFFGEGTTWSTAIPRFFDGDADGDVDLEDFLTFARCFNGPNRPPAEVDCAGEDIDRDDDVDLADVAAFAWCFNGPNRPAACGP